MSELKSLVRSHWNREVCGTRYGRDSVEEEIDLERIAETRYRMQPFILDLADFPSGRGKKVLEIGVGGGSDFLQWLKNGAELTGVDLTEAGIELTRKRLQGAGFSPGDYELRIDDAENLAFPDNTFDIVYSYGVLHHTPDTPKAFSEAYRVLKPQGELRAMVYHVPSITGFMMWVRYCLLVGRPMHTAREAIFQRMESPGTKAYTIPEIKKLLEECGYEQIEAHGQLAPSDLLTVRRSEIYSNPIYAFIWKLYPRWIVKWLGNDWGFFILIRATK
jgi:ubiquinone/menaquinone biosynthesis C-methylase UbiE